jgi:hypothetical protein
LKSRLLIGGIAVALGLAVVALGSNAGAAKGPTTLLSRLHVLTKVASTVPADGDVNPYGVAVVTATAGDLVAGDTLVSNFNDKANAQGTGTTIVEVSPAGSTRLFADLSSLPAGMSCPGGVGLTTALGILTGGYVVVGSLPTKASGGALPGLDPAGCLIVLNDVGTPVTTFTNADIDAPWDLAVASTPTSAQLFVSNALGPNISTHHGVPAAGNCMVVRLDLSLSPSAPPALTSTTVIGSDFPWRANKAALVLAPTGLALGATGTLYVDDSLTNTVSAIPDATSRTSALSMTASTISSGGSLDAPLGLTLVPGGNLLVVNGNNGNAVELTPTGKQITTRTVIKHGAGDLFGLAMNPANTGVLLVNDGTNALDLLHR